VADAQGGLEEQLTDPVDPEDEATGKTPIDSESTEGEGLTEEIVYDALMTLLENEAEEGADEDLLNVVEDYLDGNAGDGQVYDAVVKAVVDLREFADRRAKELGKEPQLPADGEQMMFPEELALSEPVLRLVMCQRAIIRGELDPAAVPRELWVEGAYYEVGRHKDGDDIRLTVMRDFTQRSAKTVELTTLEGELVGVLRRETFEQEQLQGFDQAIDQHLGSAAIDAEQKATVEAGAVADPEGSESNKAIAYFVGEREKAGDQVRELRSEKKKMEGKIAGLKRWLNQPHAESFLIPADMPLKQLIIGPLPPMPIEEPEAAT